MVKPDPTIRKGLMYCPFYIFLLPETQDHRNLINEILALLAPTGVGNFTPVCGMYCDCFPGSPA